MTTPGECYGCDQPKGPLKRRVIRTHPARDPFEVELCDECFASFDRGVARNMKANGIMARRLAEIAGRMGGASNGD